MRVQLDKARLVEIAFLVFLSAVLVDGMKRTHAGTDQALAESERNRGVDLFIAACQWQGGNPTMIYTGYVEYETTITKLPPSEDELRKSVQEHTENLRKLNANSPDKIRAKVEESIAQLPDSLRIQLSQNSRSRVKLLFGGNDATGKRLAHMEYFDWETKEWQRHAAAGLCSRTEEGSWASVLWDREATQAVINSNPGGADEVTSFGRIQGLPAQMATAALLGGPDALKNGVLEHYVFPPDLIAAFKKQLAAMAASGKMDPLRVTEELDYETEGHAFVVESRFETESGFSTSQRYWIDPARGHVCPLVQICDEKGRVVSEWKSNDYFLIEECGLWYPASHRCTLYDPETGEIRERREYTINNETIWFNRSVADEQFAIDIPAGAGVLDARDETNQLSFETTCPIVLSLARDGLDLTKKTCLQPVRVRDQPTPVTLTDSSGRQFWLLALGNVVFLIILGVAMFRRRRRGRSASLLLLSSLLLTHMCGCAEAGEIELQSSSHCPSETIVTVDPENVDFGLVRETDGPVQKQFSIVNHTDVVLTDVRVTSGCGCTVPVLSTTTVRPKQRIDVPVTFNPARRLGKFSTAVRVEIAAPKAVVTVPNIGIITRDLWVRGGTVRCTTPASAEKFSGRFEVCTVDWPQVQFDLSRLPNGIELRELSRKKEDELTVIAFHFVATAPTKNQPITTQTIELSPVNCPLTPLVVPIVSYPLLRDDGDVSNPHRIFPKRISLGTLPPGVQRTFGIYGNGEVLRDMALRKQDGAPRGLSVQLATYQEKPTPRRPLTIHIDPTADPGLFAVRVLLSSPEDNELSITLVGAIGSDT